MARRKKEAAPPKRVPVLKSGIVEQVETYVAPRPYVCAEPSAVNFISIQRYRVTVEVIEESREVLAARLMRLYRTSQYNGHMIEPFRRVAAELGMEPLRYEDAGIDYKGRPR